MNVHEIELKSKANSCTAHSPQLNQEPPNIETDDTVIGCKLENIWLSLCLMKHGE